MTRLYFEKKGFKNFHRAYIEKKELKTKFGINCKVIEKEDKTAKLEVTSVKEISQNLLKERNFEVVKVETFQSWPFLFISFAEISDPIMKRIKGVRAACEQHGVETT